MLKATFVLVFSQHEFIELVGFDDIPEESCTTSKTQHKRERRRSKKEREGKFWISFHFPFPSHSSFLFFFFIIITISYFDCNMSLVQMSKLSVRNKRGLIGLGHTAICIFLVIETISIKGDVSWILLTVWQFSLSCWFDYVWGLPLRSFWLSHFVFTTAIPPFFFCHAQPLILVP